MYIPNRRIRKSRGSQIAEFGAVIVLGVPLLIGLIFIAVEVGHYFAIKSAMDVGARNTARALVVNFNNTNGQKAAPTSAAVNNGTGQTIPPITLGNYIADGSQYTVTWDTANPPANVTVECAYPQNGAFGLPVFPNYGPISYFHA